MLNRLNIRGKMILILLTIFVSILIFTYIFFSTVRSVEEYDTIEIGVEKLKASMLMLRRHEKDFLLRKKLYYRDKFVNEYKNSLSLALILEEQLKTHHYFGKEIQQYMYNLKLYREYFLDLTNAMQERGLDENSGLYGSLREAIHKVQNYAKVINSESLLAKIYELRKNEKDFMLRKNLVYSKEFIRNFEKLDFDSIDVNMKKYLLAYKKEFLQLVEKEVVCGLNENMGLEGKMRNHVHITESLLYKLSKNILAFEINKKNNMFQSMYITALVSIFIILFLVLLISNNILKSLYVFQKGLLEFFDYLNKKKKNILSIRLNQQDEFGEMAEMINKQISQTAKFLKEEEERLDKLASYDQLTGIYNRRKFHKVFELQMSELKRYGKKSSVVLMDLDDFKKINDTYGHSVGDIVLKEFVNIVKKNIRDIDIFARWGGEEFVIFLPNIDLDNAYIVAEKIRKAVKSYHSKSVESFSISLGVTSVRVDDTIDTLINRADIALYKAKTEGKNKTVVYEKMNKKA